MTSTSAALETALADFKECLAPKELEKFQNTTLKDVQETALRIQNEQDNMKTMMNLARLKSFLEAMDQFGKVINVFVNASSFVAFVWGPMQFLLQTTSAWVDTFETVVDAYSQIGEHMPMLEQYERLFKDSPEMRRVLTLIYTDILTFHKKAIWSVTGRVWKQVFRSIWKDFNARFKQILGSLSRHKQLIIEQAEVLHMNQYQTDRLLTLQFIQNYEHDRYADRIRHKREEEDERKKNYLGVLEFFAAAKTTKQDHAIFCNVRNDYEGTGKWILNDEKVQGWIEPDIPVSSLLWIKGIPGAGKTILASVIIEKCLQDLSYTTSYFYCKENDPLKNDCISIYRGILSQLLNQCRKLVRYCSDKRSSSGEVTLTTTALAERLLKLFCEEIEKQYIIIDGLDECDPAQRKLVLSFFTAMVERCDERDPGKLRVLFISQDYPDIEKPLHNAKATVLKLTAEDSLHDIKAYVRDWSEKIRVRYDLDNETIEDIQEATCIRSQGMFLFAKLVMENLYAQGSKQDVIEETQRYRFPKGLKEAYERIMSRMKRDLREPEWKIARKLLGWMICAKRPLRWREIQAAMSIDLDDQSFQFEERKLRSDIQDYCGSLILILPGDQLELVHTTAKMYITGTGDVKVAIVECNLAALCLRYLTFECFDEDVKQERLRQTISNGILSLQDYAVSKGLEHVRAVIDKAPQLSISDMGTAEAMQELEIAIDEFSDRYENEILHEPIIEMAVDGCNLFKAYEFYDNLLHIWSHICQQTQKGSVARNDISIKSLGDALKRNRILIEDLLSKKITFENQEKEALTIYYGENLFKCEKVTCFYFHEGFKDAKKRQKHMNRHDRPFACDFPDCSIAEFGFSSNKDLEKHRRFFHPDIDDQANSFAVVTKPTSVKQYECTLCGKKFTRSFHLKNHTNSHTGTRPYPCTECGKAFTRDNDRKRHEKIHERRK